jgi:class 3 adenylate cyclase/tetratricopeptide (TPR) repeat protein
MALGEQAGNRWTVDGRRICPTCGSTNEAAAHYCHSCGSTLPTRPAATGESRKTVTVLFSDVAGSTPLGEAMDPEPFRRIMSDYFEEMRSILERHGGTVEKFIGDAVLAVFGVPQIREDDALRAVRAAVEMRDGLHRLNEKLERSWGVTLATRTGVNTGEVVAGEPGRGQSFVAGDAVNIGARLEQSAEPGEILIGEATYRLVRDAVTAERAGPLTLKGKAEPLYAWRLFEVIPEAAGWTRRLESPLVDREADLRLLHELFDRTVGESACHLIVVTGPAGVGKSRLTNEFLAALGGHARVVKGRCLPYGEGITFWPIVEMLREAAEINEGDSPEEARAKIHGLIPAGKDSELVRDRLAALLGVTGAIPEIQETFWAIRKLIEQWGRRMPLVAVFDDIHWGEPTFLDLLEYLVDWIRGVPVTILCITRTDLLESRPGWVADKPNSTLIALQPLSDSDTEALIENLVGRTDLVAEAQTRIAEMAEGNPLFVEETLRMLVDDGLLRRLDGGWSLTGDLSAISIPPTIHSLIAARLDRLSLEERAVVQEASVVGRVFWWGAVAALSSSEFRPRVGRHLQALMRKELILPDYSSLSDEDTFRFTHILIRDAAYNAIPKSTRAELHERLADWIEAKSRDRAGEYEEVIGYHLEQAHRALIELKPMTGIIEVLGRRAATWLASAGRRAFARGDMPAAVNLLSRAASLFPQDAPERLEVLPRLAFALMETGDFAKLQSVVAGATEAAAASGDSGLQAHTVILGLWIRLFTSPEGWAELARKEGTRAISTFEQLGDERGLAEGWSLLGLVNMMKAEFGPAEEAWQNAAAHAHLSGDQRDELESLSWVPLTVWAGPTPVEEALRRCRDVIDRAQGDKKPTSSALFMSGACQAMLGNFEEARDLIVRARGLLEELMLPVWIAGPLAQVTGWVELMAGDAPAAERALRAGFETLSQIGEISWLSTTAAILAESLYSQGRDDEAAQFAQVCAESAGNDDTYSQIMWRSVRAKVLARRGQVDEAHDLARHSADLAEGTDFLHLRAYTLMSLSEVLQAAGRFAESEHALRESLMLCELKGNVAVAQRAREALEKMAGDPSAPDAQ